jgi:hypothetical protein
MRIASVGIILIAGPLHFEIEKLRIEIPPPGGLRHSQSAGTMPAFRKSAANDAAAILTCPPDLTRRRRNTFAFRLFFY